MQIKSVSVRGYRTIRDELSFDLDNMVTLVGPNNAGKTNTLKAIQLFFTGYENELNYKFEKDMCKGEKSLRTNIQITFRDIDPLIDKDLSEIVHQIRSYLKILS
ncbi:AAA family ATPase [Blastomonas fulva]